MKRGLSNNKPDQSLPRSKILRGKRNFERLFNEGLVVRGTVVYLRYFCDKSDNPEIKMAFIASKRLGNAVVRNRIKRRMREAYRIHRHLLNPFTEKGLLFHAAVIAKKPRASFSEVEADLIDILTRVCAINHGISL